MREVKLPNNEHVSPKNKPETRKEAVVPIQETSMENTLDNLQSNLRSPYNEQVEHKRKDLNPLK